MEYFFHDGTIAEYIVEEGKITRKVKAYQNEIMMVEVFFKNGAVGTMHEHSHSQVAYCLEGSFEFTVAEKTCVINVGDSVYMPPGVIHGCKLLTEKGRLLDVFTPFREDYL